MNQHCTPSKQTLLGFFSLLGEACPAKTPAGSALWIHPGPQLSGPSVPHLPAGLNWQLWVGETTPPFWKAERGFEIKISLERQLLYNTPIFQPVAAPASPVGTSSRPGCRLSSSCKFQRVKGASSEPAVGRGRGQAQLQLDSRGGAVSTVLLLSESLVWSICAAKELPVSA